jgi:hypothetical protein
MTGDVHWMRLLLLFLPQKDAAAEDLSAEQLLALGLHEAEWNRLCAWAASLTSMAQVPAGSRAPARGRC